MIVPPFDGIAHPCADMWPRHRYRNRRRARNRHAGQPAAPERRRLNPDKLARDLVALGVCSPLILGPQPPRRDEAHADAGTALPLLAR